MTEIKITRRIALDRPYEYYELEATYDTVDAEGKAIIKDIEKMVRLIMKATAPKESKTTERAAKIPTKDEDPVTRIADLKANDKKVNISVRLVEVGEVKEFKRAGQPDGRFCKVDVEDETGKIKLTLFDEQIDLIKDIKENAWLTLENAYVKEFRGVIELSVGKWGNMEVVYNG